MSIKHDLRGWTSFTGLFIVGYHVALVIGLPFYFWLSTPGWPLIAASALVLFATQIGICGGYHRFYAHRGYALHPVVEGVMLFSATLALQGSALRWAYDHRLHHSHSDTERDPYSITRGFWHAHFLWLFEPAEEIDMRLVRDLEKNRLVMFQHRYYGWLAAASNLGVVALVGWAVGDWLGAFVMAGWLRIAITHHMTWSINSLAHSWGERTYSREHTAVDNHLLALITVGEGYHNYHHTFPSDYRNGVHWYQFDPTKWIVWTLEKVGLARNLRRHSPDAIRRRLLLEDRKLLLEKLDAGVWATRREEFEKAIHHLSDVIHQKLEKLNELRGELAERSGGRAAHQAVRREMKRLKASLREDWKRWFELCGTVLDGAPA